MSKVAISEQIYRDLETRAVGQIRYEYDDGSVEWLRADGSYWDGEVSDPASQQLHPAPNPKEQDPLT